MTGQGNVAGPVYDLPTVMTKFLHLGMPLPAIIRAVTSTPARVWGLGDTVGSLAVGREADVSVLELQAVDVALEDAHGQRRLVTTRILPRAVWRAGAPCEIVLPALWPNPAAGTPSDLEAQRLRDPDWQALVAARQTCCGCP